MYARVYSWIEENSKELYTVGRNGFAIALMLYGLARLTDHIQQREDLRQYYFFWSAVSSVTAKKNPTDEDLQELASHTYFRLQRYLSACLFLVAGALIIAEKVYGSLLAVGLILYNCLYHANPWIFQDQLEQKDAWILFIKQLAVVGGAIFIMTRGKLRSENQKVKIESPLAILRKSRTDRQYG